MHSRPLATTLTFVLVAVLGGAAWWTLPVELVPDLSLPSVTVTHQWGTTDPETVETELTRAVEGLAYGLRDLESVRSVSAEGSSQVTIGFRRGAPVDFRVLELQERLHALHEGLPEGVSPHRLVRSVPQELEQIPEFMTWSVNGPYPPETLRRWAETRIRLPLAGLPGLADIRLDGVPEPALWVEFDPERLERFGLRAPNLLALVSDRLSWRSSGFVEIGGGRHVLEIPPADTTLAALEALPVPVPGLRDPMRLGDFARVRTGTVPPLSVRRVNGNPALTLTFRKEPGADALALAEQVRHRLETIASGLPTGVELRLETDATAELRQQLDELRLQSGASLGFIFLVLALVLRSWKAPVVILGSVLLSLLLSGIGFRLLGLTLNLFTLAGLTVSLGLIIDNALVVHGHGRRQREAVVPVIAATATTIGIFIPLYGTIESLQAFLVPLATALTVSLSASVVVSLTFIPFMTDRNGGTEAGPWNDAGWQSGLRWRHKGRFVLAAAVLASAGWTGWTATKQVRLGDPWRLPGGDVISVFVRPPQGSPLEETDKILRSFEAVALPYADLTEQMVTEISESYGGNLAITLKEGAAVVPDAYRLLNDLAYLSARTGNVASSVMGLEQSFGSGFAGQQAQHRIVLQGPGYRELQQVAETLAGRLQENPRVRNVDVNAQWGGRPNRNFVLRPDGDRLATHGLDRSALLDALALDLGGRTPFGEIEWNGERMALIGRAEDGRMREQTFRERVRTQRSGSFRLTDVADLGREEALARIIRRDQSYERAVAFDFLGPSRMAAEYSREVRAAFPLPVGVRFAQDGTFLFQDDAVRSDMWRVLVGAVVCVWLIVAALLNRWKTALFVLGSVVWATSGVAAGALAHDLDFGRGAMAGALLCIGVVVNNSILLYHGRSVAGDWAATYRAHTRTILLTTGTTLAGLLPMILWGTDPFWEQLAVVTAWGLGVGTALTLLVTGMWEKPRSSTD